jgi:hypothetical protein
MKGLSAIIAIGLGLSLAASAADAGYRHKKDKLAREHVGNYELSKRKPQVRGYLFRPGGHSYAFEYEPFLRRNGPYGNFPEFDPRTFHEKVLSDPRFATTSPSAF